MFSSRNRPSRWILALSAFAALVPLAAGCGGGGGGPQVNPTPTPTTAPVATRRIAWMSDRDGTFHLYVMNGDGTGQVRPTQNPGLERSPSWSKDGSQLVFSYSENKSLAGAEIYTIRADGSGLTRLTNNNLDDDAPVFSLDGQFVAWSQATGSLSSAIFIANRDGSGARRVTATNDFARTPSFDAQGRIIYSSRSSANTGSSSRYQIVRVNQDGSGRTQLTVTTSNLYSASVSPDGNTLLYVDDVSGDFELYTSPVSSFAPQRLSFSVAGDANPTWTPDGRIVFASIRDGNTEIYVANRDGSALQRLTNNPSTDRLPSATGPSVR